MSILCVRVIKIHVLFWPPLNPKHLLLSVIKLYFEKLIRLLRSRNSGRLEAYPGQGMEPILLNFFPVTWWLSKNLVSYCHCLKKRLYLFLWRRCDAFIPVTFVFRLRFGNSIFQNEFNTDSKCSHNLRMDKCCFF